MVNCKILCVHSRKFNISYLSNKDKLLGLLTKASVIHTAVGILSSNIHTAVGILSSVIHTATAKKKVTVIVT